MDVLHTISKDISAIAPSPQITTVLETGQLLFFPQLSFPLQSDEQRFLTPHCADGKAKNISYDPIKKYLQGTSYQGEQRLALQHMVARYANYAEQLIKKILPTYANYLQIGRTSYRPVQASHRKQSPRQNDTRLHVDAFSTNPVQGKRILRVFTNVNPYNQPRVWQVGESFETVVQQFLSQLHAPFPGSATLLKWLKITKKYRTLYDHYMLQLHDRMKLDELYQNKTMKTTLHLLAGSTWMVFIDCVSHAALSGQYLFEQTFYCPVSAMMDESRSPLRILEKNLNRKLI